MSKIKKKKKLGDFKSYFRSLPISKYLVRGLDDASFKKMTEIQKKAIPVGLRGENLIATAKTGSGKTLAFLVPVVQMLIDNNWQHLDRMGALIISPNRELCIQIHDVLKEMTKSLQQLITGCVVGGEDFKAEAKKFPRMHIVVGTPGRLLQHFGSTPNYDVSGLKTLVLDEYDRILDMGFAPMIDQILDYLPSKHQTLLFSATSELGHLRHLKKLGLEKAHRIAVYEGEMITPASNVLRQYYAEVPYHDKFNIFHAWLKSTIKEANHAKRKEKIILFCQTVKEVRFFYKALRLYGMGFPIGYYYGRMKQSIREKQYRNFKNFPSGLLICTGIANRGLDFPGITWICQIDCPPDVETYIHRVGRGARLSSKDQKVQKSQALLFIDPSEKEIVTQIKKKNIKIRKVELNSNIKPQNLFTHNLKSFVARSADLKYLAQSALQVFVKSIYLQPDKKIFNEKKIDRQKLAENWGLLVPPDITLGESLNVEKNENFKLKNLLSSKELKAKKQKSILQEKIRQKKEKSKKTRAQKLLDRSEQGVLEASYLKKNTKFEWDKEFEEEEDEDFFKKANSQNSKKKKKGL